MLTRWSCVLKIDRVTSVGGSDISDLQYSRYITARWEYADDLKVMRATGGKLMTQRKTALVVEVEPCGLVWRKSSRSNPDKDPKCVEVAAFGSLTHVRDSKSPVGAKLTFPAFAWSSFLLDISAGRCPTNDA